MVADQLAVEAGEDRRSAGETRPILLAALGGEPSDSTTVWSHARQDRSAALARWVGKPTN